MAAPRSAQKLIETPHPLWLGCDILETTPELLRLERYSKICLVADSVLPIALVEGLRDSLGESAAFIPFSVSEEGKSLDGAVRLWNAFHRAGLDRASAVIALGGGVLGDLAGFAAATYMRGCSFFFLPTTLLAQVDASIGGKTGINFESVKNLLGVISQPAGVVVDTGVLRSLPPRQVAAGYAEMLKHGLIADTSYLERLSAAEYDLATPEFAALVAESIRIKAEIVAADPTEQGRRKLLNFGHSIGHAVEAVAISCGRDMTHGEAVAIGMVAESAISHSRGWIPSADLVAIESMLKKRELPIRIKEPLPREEVVSRLRSDKKNIGGQVRMALLRSLGSAQYDLPVTMEEIESSLNYVFRTNNR